MNHRTFLLIAYRTYKPQLPSVFLQADDIFMCCLSTFFFILQFSYDSMNLPSVSIFSCILAYWVRQPVSIISNLHLCLISGAMNRQISTQEYSCIHLTYGRIFVTLSLIFSLCQVLAAGPDQGGERTDLRVGRDAGVSDVCGGSTRQDYPIEHK